jgi:hypothetical protein
LSWGMNSRPSRGDRSIPADVQVRDYFVGA